MPDIENMDDLVRRAAEDYPLKNGMDDWDAIAPLLTKLSPVGIAGNHKKSKKRTSSLLLLLLLFLVIAGIKVGNDYYKPSEIVATSTASKTPVKETNEADNNRRYKDVTLSEQEKPATKQTLNSEQDIINSNRLATPKPPIALEERRFDNGEHKEITDDKTTEKTEQANGSFLSEPISLTSISKEKSVIEKLHVVKYSTSKIIFGQSIVSIELAATTDNSSSANKIFYSKKATIKKQHSIYAGIMFGASFNQIKTQGLKKPGYDIGVVAGYQINKLLSVETGLMYDRKYYFTSGKYFDMAKVSSSMPADMKLLNIEGSSAIFEIPLRIKYNLDVKSHSKFFTTAGVSTYIITREYNKYRALTNGAEQNITGTYTNTSRYLAATLGISLGYQNKIGSFGTVRIEPYLQMPLKGIGVGSLPVMTAGLHVGITRLIH